MLKRIKVENSSSTKYVSLDVSTLTCHIFECELASLVVLQVLSSKEEEENFLTSFNKPRLEA